MRRWVSLRAEKAVRPRSASLGEPQRQRLSTDGRSTRTAASHELGPLQTQQLQQRFRQERDRQEQSFQAFLSELRPHQATRHEQFRTFLAGVVDNFEGAQATRWGEWLALQDELFRRDDKIREERLARTREDEAARDSQAGRSLQHCEALARESLEDFIAETRRALVDVCEILAQPGGRTSAESQLDHDAPSFDLEYSLSSIVALSILLQSPTKLSDSDWGMLAILDGPDARIELRELILTQTVDRGGAPPQPHTNSAVEPPHGHDFTRVFEADQSRRESAWRREEGLRDSALDAWEASLARLRQAVEEQFSHLLNDAPARLLSQYAVYESRARFRTTELRRATDMELLWHRTLRDYQSHGDRLLRDLRNQEQRMLQTLSVDDASIVDLERSPDVRSHLTGSTEHETTESHSVAAPSSAVSEVSSGTREQSSLRQGTTSINMYLHLPQPASAPLPTLSPGGSIKARDEFALAETRRDRIFQDSIKALRAHSEVAEAVRAARFTAGMARWEDEAASAERTRRVEFESKMQTTRAEWSARQVQRLKQFEDAMYDITVQYGKAQLRRDESFATALRKVHVAFVSELEKLPQAYRAFNERMRVHIRYNSPSRASGMGSHVEVPGGEESLANGFV
ncbi:hypothetical protein AURDEDRAFT_133334 [Auricularia subglabra TFB-10046 SS5]|nr:hypothetical protein AURDEDRAFT_133334 [Auricularia subglabra TFB-10046 SS5]